MRDMAHPNADSTRNRSGSRLRIARFRPWVQTAFLGVWLAPLGRWLHAVPGCVFHCYACPLSSLACPVGVVAQFTALHIFPLLAVGILVAVGALVASLVCGWACPFGFLQDLFARIPTPKFSIPNWMSHGRYLVLVGMVVAVPYLWGESHRLFICQACPAGALESGGRGLPGMVRQGLTGGIVNWMGWEKLAVLSALVVAMLFTYRPWCKVACPLGGFLALFNRISVFHLRFEREDCTECNLCRSRCSMGVQVERKVNDSRCIRCMECTTCGAIRPALARWANKQARPAEPAE